MRADEQFTCTFCPSEPSKPLSLLYAFQSPFLVLPRLERHAPAARLPVHGGAREESSSGGRFAHCSHAQLHGTTRRCDGKGIKTGC